jgi:DNA-binding protein H-NS
LRKELETVALSNADGLRQAEEQLAEAGHEILLAQSAAEAFPPPVAQVAPLPAVQQRLQKIVSRGRPNAGKTLVIRSSDTDPKVQANMEEDLNVMSRILDKAATQKSDDDRPARAMGIDVFFTPGSSPMRSLYLEGYGAIFLLNVNYPLLAPPEKAEKEKERSEEDSAWHQAKRELYGPREGWEDEAGHVFKYGLAGAGPGQPYDEERVADLKKALLDALKNAANIRNLKADESVTVCVFGASSRTEKPKPTAKRSTRAQVAQGEDSNEVVVWSGDDRHPGPSRGSVMTIRVKKADVDAFAKGKLEPDAFAKKALATTYAADSSGWGGVGVFDFGY